MKGCIAGLLMLSFYVSIVAGFVQHIITCIKEEAVLFLTIGVILPPVGVIHGWGIWLGIW